MKLNNKTIKMISEASSFCQSNELHAAKSIYLKLIKQIPANLEVINNLGVIEVNFGNIEEAKRLFEKSLLLNKNQPLILSNLGNIYIELQDNLKAIELFEESLVLNPSSATTHFNLGKAFANLDLYDDSISAYITATKINPIFAKAHMNLGFTYNKIGKYVDAIGSYTASINLDSKVALSFYNRAVAYENSKSFSKAMDDYNSSLSIEPNNPKTNLNKGLLNLLLGNMQEGWVGYDKRLTLNHTENYFASTKPELYDFNLINKRIMIYAEQGLGDQILFCSLIKDAIETNNYLIISLDERLLPLMARSFKNFQNLSFVSNEKKVSDELFDYHLPIGNLGKFFRLTYKDFEVEKKTYLTPDKVKAINLNKRMRGVEGNKVLCGISWKSTKTNAASEKSLNLVDFLPLFKLPNIKFIDLQYGDCENEKNQLQNEYGIKIESVSDIDNYNDIDGLAALIESCDFVVTSSSVTAHLAGAINKKTFLLLPYHFGVSWYWHVDDLQSRWYPAVKIFRQSEYKSWKNPISMVVKELS